MAPKLGLELVYEDEPGLIVQNWLIFYIIRTIIFPARVSAHYLNKLFLFKKKLWTDVIEETPKLFELTNDILVEGHFTRSSMTVKRIPVSVF